MLIRLMKIRALTRLNQSHSRDVRVVQLRQRLNSLPSPLLQKPVVSLGKKKKPSSSQTRQKLLPRASVVQPKWKMTMTMMSISQMMTKTRSCRESRLRFLSLVHRSPRMEQRRRRQLNLQWAKRFILQGVVEAGVATISISGCAIVVNRRR